MTKEQFLKTYGQPNTVVSFKNDAEKMEFLKECEGFDIVWANGQKATKYKPELDLIGLDTGTLGEGRVITFVRMNYAIIRYAPSPKSLIKDGWIGVQRNGLQIHLLPSIDLYVYADTQSYRINEFYYDDLEYKPGRSKDIMELYDNLGNLQWKREEKSATDIEIERIQAEMERLASEQQKLADDLSKLKGE